MREDGTTSLQRCLLLPCRPETAGATASYSSSAFWGEQRPALPRGFRQQLRNPCYRMLCRGGRECERFKKL